MRVLTAAEAAQIATGSETDPRLLIQRAGYAVAQFCIAEFKFHSVCVVCGEGRKGAVGRAAAGILAGVSARVRVIVVAGQADRRNSAVDDGLPSTDRPIWIRQEHDFDSEAVRAALSSDLIVDAIAGTGFHPPVRPLASAAISAINRVSGIVVSVDVPSGVDSDSAAPMRMSGGNMVFAQGILALMAPKPAHVFGDLTAGPIAVSEIGVQPAVAGNGRLSVLTGRDVRVAFSRRSLSVGETDLAHVLVIGGDNGSAGAPALAALAALRAGADRVTVACPVSVEAMVAAHSASLFTHALPETSSGSIATAAAQRIEDLLVGKQAVIVGPGLIANPETAGFVRQLTASCRVPVVLSGGGLTSFVGRQGELGQEMQRGAFRVICFDVAEALEWFEGLCHHKGSAERTDLAKTICAMSGACVVLKDAKTAIAGPSGETWINLSGGPIPPKAGMSEILVGIVGAALARGAGSDTSDGGRSSPPFHLQFLRDLQVAAAVHLHGVATHLARNLQHEHALLAEHVLEALPEAFKACDRQAESGLFHLRD